MHWLHRPRSKRSSSRCRRRLRARTGAALCCVLALASSCVVTLPGERATPAGPPRNQAVYVRAADDTRLAVDVWLPAELAGGETVPALIQGSRYWRAVQATALGRFLHLLGVDAPGTGLDPFQRHFVERGYAYVTVDARGTGASFGVHDTEYSLQEVSDYRAVLDWVVAQPWSSGRLGAVGNSYAGTTAELMTTIRHPALRAAAPLYAAFDPQFHLVMPGGVHQPAFVNRWSALVAAMDRNDMCGVASAATGNEIRGLACAATKLVAPGVKPVDGPDGSALLRNAVAEHDSPNIAGLLPGMEHRDDPWSPLGYSAADALPYGRKQEIEASLVPLYVVAGWLDAATADGALARFAGLANRQSVWIGPFSHGGDHDTDPFRSADAPPVWEQTEQLERLEQFFAAHLKGEGSPPPEGLHYYVMGAGVWKTTHEWPPAGSARRAYFLTQDRNLRRTKPERPGRLRYEVDFSAATGGQTRWMTQLAGADVRYHPPRDTRGVLAFRTTPFEQDMELTGSPVLTLWLASDRSHGAVHAYLQDVAPDGTVRYLTEGVLALQHRAVTSDPPYPDFGTGHSFLAADAAPMPPARPQRVTLGLFATSVLVRRGHALRLIVAGADATSFARVPRDGPAPVWTLHVGGNMASSLSLPLGQWSAD